MLQKTADLVYLPSESDRQEYVLNDFGIIFTGSRESVEYREWYYDQFKTNSLLATLYVLDRSGLTPAQRADPVQVGRMLSQVVSNKWFEEMIQILFSNFFYKNVQLKSISQRQTQTMKTESFTVNGQNPTLRTPHRGIGLDREPFWKNICLAMVCPSDMVNVG